MSLPRYPAYKDSGVSWLGEVPAHWEIKRLKHLGEAIIGLTYDPSEVVKEEDGILVLRSSNVQKGKIAFEDNVFVAKEIPKKLFTIIDDVLICSRNGSRALIGKNALITKEAAGVTFGAFMTIFRSSINKYLYWVFNSQIFSFQSSTFLTSTINQLTTGNLYSFAIPLPSNEEQSAIAAFLDRETAKIDALISEQEKLIALLAEKRQATISRAVTRGLDPNVPRKDSGVPWLGKVPAHWEVTRLKHVTDLIVDCPHETPVYDDTGEYLVIRTADISEGRLDTSAMYSVGETEYLSRIRRQALVKDDIVYGREGERWGYAALVPEDDVFCLGQRMMQFRPDKAMCSRYLMWQLNSRSTYRQGQIDTVGATSPHVNVGTIRNYVLAKPPRKEQVDISSFLDEETSRLDALDTEANRTIRLLKERRAALISAAVTGKTDVRGLAA